MNVIFLLINSIHQPISDPFFLARQLPLSTLMAAVTAGAGLIDASASGLG
jgi:hypothetical protein